MGIHALYDSDEKQKHRAWVTILYPESCNPDWIWEFKSTHLGGLAILHDKDILKDAADDPLEDRTKKAHVHLMLINQSGPISYKNAFKYTDALGGVGCQYVDTISGYARYLTHMDDPDKYQYDFNDVLEFGGVRYRDAIKFADGQLLPYSDFYKELKEAIRLTGSNWFSDILDYFAANGNDVMFDNVCKRSQLVARILGSTYASNTKK